jgi:hypothetical protein
MVTTIRTFEGPPAAATVEQSILLAQRQILHRSEARTQARCP